MYNPIHNAINSQKRVRILNFEWLNLRLMGLQILLLYTKVCEHIEGNIKGPSKGTFYMVC